MQEEQVESLKGKTYPCKKEYNNKTLELKMNYLILNLIIIIL